MPKGSGIRLPKTPVYKPLYAKKVTVEAHNKIDQIVDDLGVSKWAVIDALICSALGTKTINKLDVTKYLKGLK